MSLPAGVVLGRPRPEEAARLAQVHVQCWREAYATLLPESFYGEEALARRTEMWTRALARRDVIDRTLVARSDRAIVGLTHRGTPEEAEPAREVQLAMLYVLSPWYGTGVGQALLTQILGTEPAQLWVARENPRARRFYEKNGFVPDGFEQTDPDLDGLVEIRMVR